MSLESAHRLISEDDLQRAAVICDATQEDCPVIFVSKAFEIHTGYSQSEVLGKNLRLLQGPGTSPESIHQFAEAIAEQVPVTIDILNYRKDGTEFINRVHLKPIKNDDGIVTHFAAIQSIV